MNISFGRRKYKTGTRRGSTDTCLFHCNMCREQHGLFRKSIFLFLLKNSPECFFQFSGVQAGNRNIITGRIFPWGYAAFSLKNRLVIGCSGKTQGRNYVI
jgi:hypothetical protein